MRMPHGPSLYLHAGQTQEQADARRDQDAQQRARAREGASHPVIQSWGHDSLTGMASGRSTLPHPHSSMAPSLCLHAGLTQEQADAVRDQDAQQHVRARAGRSHHRGLPV